MVGPLRFLLIFTGAFVAIKEIIEGEVGGGRETISG